MPGTGADFIDLIKQGRLAEKIHSAREIMRACTLCPRNCAVDHNALREMHRQVGNLATDADNIATRGLLVRHLVLPHQMAGTRAVMRFIANDISPVTYVNSMNQYRPCGRAAEVPGLGVYPSAKGFEDARRAAREEGIRRLDQPRRVFALR
ncbi:MAG: hypothetical protein WAM73_19950 [Desulfobacterales bacterium]